jgi:flavin-dependent dehydrogenase
VRCDVRGTGSSGRRITGVRAVIDGREAELTARVVVGADGATSAVGRALRPGPRPPAARRSVAIRAYLDGIQTLSHRVEFYFYRCFLPGYGWVFPLGRDRANVGVIVRADRYRRAGSTLERLLARFLESPAVTGRLSSGYRIRDAASWQLPNAAPPPMRNTFDGALLVGDAASLVDPLTGEGIHNALASARLAARVIGDALRAGDTTQSRLAAFDRRCERELGPLISRSQRLHRWVDRAPWWVDMLFWFAGAAPGCTQSILNRLSNDFVVRVDARGRS